MSKSVKAAKAVVAKAPLASHYIPGKYSPRPNTKNGKDGTQGTFGAICAAHTAAGRPLTLAEVVAICTDQLDPAWVRYGIRGKYIVAATV